MSYRFLVQEHKATVPYENVTGDATEYVAERTYWQVGEILTRRLSLQAYGSSSKAVGTLPCGLDNPENRR
jgi:hypothetical protein